MKEIIINYKLKQSLENINEDYKVSLGKRSREEFEKGFARHQISGKLFYPKRRKKEKLKVTNLEINLDSSQRLSDIFPEVITNDEVTISEIDEKEIENLDIEKESFTLMKIITTNSKEPQKDTIVKVLLQNEHESKVVTVYLDQVFKEKKGIELWNDMNDQNSRKIKKGKSVYYTETCELLVVLKNPIEDPRILNELFLVEPKDKGKVSITPIEIFKRENTNLAVISSKEPELLEKIRIIVKKSNMIETIKRRWWTGDNSVPELTKVFSLSTGSKLTDKEAEEHIQDFLINESIRFSNIRRNHPKAKKKWIKVLFYSFTEIIKFNERVSFYKTTKTKIVINNVIFNGNRIIFNEPMSFYELGFIEEGIGKLNEVWEIENWCTDTNVTALTPFIRKITNAKGKSEIRLVCNSLKEAKKWISSGIVDDRGRNHKVQLSNKLLSVRKDIKKGHKQSPIIKKEESLRMDLGVKSLMEAMNVLSSKIETSANEVSQIQQVQRLIIERQNYLELNHTDEVKTFQSINNQLTINQESSRLMLELVKINNAIESHQNEIKTLNLTRDNESKHLSDLLNLLVERREGLMKSIREMLSDSEDRISAVRSNIEILINRVNTSVESTQMNLKQE